MGFVKEVKRKHRLNEMNDLKRREEVMNGMSELKRMEGRKERIKAES